MTIRCWTRSMRCSMQQVERSSGPETWVRSCISRAVGKQRTAACSCHTKGCVTFSLQQESIPNGLSGHCDLVCHMRRPSRSAWRWSGNGSKLGLSVSIPNQAESARGGCGGLVRSGESALSGWSRAETKVPKLVLLGDDLSGRREAKDHTSYQYEPR